MPYKYQIDDAGFAGIYKMVCRALIAAKHYGAKWAVMHCSPKEQMVEIHDNFRNDDTHAVPFGGSIPWERVMKALKDVGYPGVFNYEIAMQWTPDALKEPFVQYHMVVGVCHCRFLIHTLLNRPLRCAYRRKDCGKIKGL